MMTPSRAAVTQILLLLSPFLLIAGCAGGGTSASPRTIPASVYKMTSPAAYNKWDVAFVKGTYLGHLQTAKVVDEAAGRTENGEVRRLATGIKSVQGPEIQLLASWLKDWKTPTPTPSAQPRKIGRLSGAALDRAVLRLLIKNQQDILRLATREQAAGVFSPARQLAERTVKSSTGILATMRTISADLKTD